METNFAAEGVGVVMFKIVRLLTTNPCSYSYSNGSIAHGSAAAMRFISSTTAHSDCKESDSPFFGSWLA